jgi:hypothetical protein
LPLANRGRTRPPAKDASDRVVIFNEALVKIPEQYLKKGSRGSTSKARTRPANTPIAKASSDSPPRSVEPDFWKRAGDLIARATQRQQQLQDAAWPKGKRGLMRPQEQWVRATRELSGKLGDDGDRRRIDGVEACQNLSRKAIRHERD